MGGAGGAVPAGAHSSPGARAGPRIVLLLNLRPHLACTPTLGGHLLWQITQSIELPLFLSVSRMLPA